MNSAIEAMLSRYSPRNNTDRENAIKEIIQEIALAGLSRGGFFERAGFYGGACLRMFHGLNRFSENLDFALLEKDPEFKLDAYLPYLEKEFLSYGLSVNIELKKKGANGKIQSAFLKGNTLMLMMSFYPSSEEARRIMPSQKLKVKFEIDTDNPEGGRTEFRYRMLPAPYEIRIFDEDTLFAGKIHAILCRQYKNRVKGRDYYDYLFYIGKGSSFNLEYLENKLKNTGAIDEETVLTLDSVKAMLQERFSTVDYEAAKEDVSSFIEDKESLTLWKPALFISTLDGLTAK